MQQYLTLFVVAILFIGLARGMARPDLLFGGALVVLVVLGAAPAETALSGFSHPAVFTVGAFLVVAHGLQLTRAFDSVFARLFHDRLSVKSMSVRMMALTATLSSFVNNTPLVAMMLGPVSKWAVRNGAAKSRLLIPLSYLTILGGLVTVIGTSTTLIVSGLLSASGNQPLGFWELTPVGLSASVLAILFFATLGARNLSGGGVQGAGPHTDGMDDPDRYHFNLSIPTGSAIDGLTVDNSGLRSLRHAYLAYVIRGGTNIGIADPELTLRADDVLCFVGSYPGIEELARSKGLRKSTWDERNMPQGSYLYEAVVSNSSSLVGKTLKEAGFRERFAGVVIAIRRRDGLLLAEIGRTPIKAGDLLLIEAREGFDKQWNTDMDDFYMVTRKSTRPTMPTHKGGTAAAIVALLLTACISGVLELPVAALGASILMVAAGCIPKSEVYRAANIPVLIVIASSIGIGETLESTGIAGSFAGWLAESVSGQGLMATAAAVYLLTNAVTEVLPNQSAAVLMMPIALSLSGILGIDTHAFAIPVAIAASSSFLTPTGYQTNLMVMSPGGYRFGDYAKAGWPLTLMLFCLTMAYVWLRFAP